MTAGPGSRVKKPGSAHGIENGVKTGTISTRKGFQKGCGVKTPGVFTRELGTSNKDGDLPNGIRTGLGKVEKENYLRSHMGLTRSPS
jgi:hypothetical protein